MIENLQMNLPVFQILAAFTIFASSIVMGLLPVRFSKEHQSGITTLEAIASGIFLGAALFHMVPDAQNGFNQLGLTSFPYTMLLSVCSFILLLLLERISRAHFTGLLLTIVLSLHAFIAGAALGISKTIGAALVIFLAIIAHKSCESFALVMALRRTTKSNQQVLLLLLLFSFMTPLGILLASSTSAYLNDTSSQLAEAILNGITAGTFFYIGTLDTLGRQLQPQRLVNRVREFVALVLGMSLMGIVAIWI